MNTVADRESKKKTTLLRVASSSQRSSSGFLTTELSNNRSNCFLRMPSTTSIKNLTSRSSQSRDRCSEAKLEHGPYICISPFHYDLKSAPKNETKMYSSPDSDCTSLEIQLWYPELINLCVKEPVLMPQGKEFLISPKCIVHPFIMENLLTLAVWLVLGKPFLVKEFQKRFSNYHKFLTKRCALQLRVSLEKMG